MKVVTVSKRFFNPITLPGMGRSIDLADLTALEAQEIRVAFSRRELYVEFAEEPGTEIPVIQLWANPHSPQVTLFV